MLHYNKNRPTRQADKTSLPALWAGIIYRIATKAGYCGRTPIGKYVIGWVKQKDIQIYAPLGEILSRRGFFIYRVTILFSEG